MRLTMRRLGRFAGSLIGRGSYPRYVGRGWHKGKHSCAYRLLVMMDDER